MSLNIGKETFKGRIIDADDTNNRLGLNDLQKMDPKNNVIKTNYAVLDWKSWKLDRVSRSSLNAETQAAATAVDVMEFCHSFINLMHEPELELKTAAFRTTRPSSLVVDAKSLYDSLKKEAPVQGSSDRRTAIEQIGLKQALMSVGASVRWASSERQMADGLTKIHARQLFSDRLIKQEYKLIYDEPYTAEKKKNAEERKYRKENPVVQKKCKRK